MNSNFFFSCDWGTTHVRVRLVDARDGTIIGQSHSAEGVGKLVKDFPEHTSRARRYEELLLGFIADLEKQSGETADTCILSGMASGRIGWQELPYAPLPVSLDGGGLLSTRFEISTRDRTISVTLISGLKADADVLRGEEIEIIGLAALYPELRHHDCVLVMPGTHSKHVRLSGGRIVSFDTIMTGELFAHLHSAPTLQVCLSRAKASPDNPWFLRGVRESSSSGLAASLFKIRARSLLDGVSGEENSAFLSGLLLGTELLLLPRSIPVHLAAGDSLAPLYDAAARELGIAVQLIPSDILEQATIAAHRSILVAA